LANDEREDVYTSSKLPIFTKKILSMNYK